MSIWYVFDEHGDSTPADVATFSRFCDARYAAFRAGERDPWEVDYAEFDGQEVSTVFLGRDLGFGFGDGPPLVFETMVFGGPYDLREFRWPTRVTAQAGHDQIVAALRAGREPRT